MANFDDSTELPQEPTSADTNASNDAPLQPPAPKPDDGMSPSTPTDNLDDGEDEPNGAMPEPPTPPATDDTSDTDGYYGDDDLKQSDDVDLSFLDDDDPNDPERHDATTKA